MKPTVNILATVRNPALLDAALLVFKTIRTGFPTAEIQVWGNNLSRNELEAVYLAADKVGAAFVNIVPTTHGKWIQGLMLNRTEPFWICDTDVVFFEPVEAWFDPDVVQLSADLLFAGRYEPEFLEEWTRTRHVARLHPSLMWLNPQSLRLAIRAWPAVDPFFNTVLRQLVEWQFVPGLRPQSPDAKPQTPDETLFFDTCAGLHHALGGTAFTDAQNEAFEHLHCGTYSDLIAPHLSLHRFAEMHREICKDPSLARGMQHEQAKYYGAGTMPALPRSETRDARPELPDPSRRRVHRKPQIEN